MTPDASRRLDRASYNRGMWPFKRRHQSAQEMAPEEPLDEELRDVGWDEFYKEADLENSHLSTAVIGPLALTGAREALRETRRRLQERDPNPADGHGPRKTRRDGGEAT
jgi:hypothetical protein